MRLTEDNNHCFVGSAALVRNLQRECIRVIDFPIVSILYVFVLSVYIQKDVTIDASVQVQP